MSHYHALSISINLQTYLLLKNITLPRSNCTKQANIAITEGKHKEMWLKTGSSYLPRFKGKCGQYFYFKFPGCAWPLNHRLNVGSNALKKILIGASQTQVKNPEIRTFQSFSNGDHGCHFHFAELLSIVDATLAGSKAACTTLANILLKAHVLNVSDKEKSLRCLRRPDKLSN